MPLRTPEARSNVSVIRMLASGNRIPGGYTSVSYSRATDRTSYQLRTKEHHRWLMQALHLARMYISFLE